MTRNNRRTYRFLGKNVLITGGSSGIGLEVAVLFGHLGANLFLVSRDGKKLQDAQNEIHKRLGESTPVVCISCDVSDERQIESAIHKVGQQYGGLHTLINNAGIPSVGLWEDKKIEEMRRVMDVNYWGMVYATKAAWPYLKASLNGHIGFVSSVAGYTGLIGYTSYSPTKFAVTGFAECIRMEAKQSNIGVSIVFPPDTDTPQLLEERKHIFPELQALTSNAHVLSPQKVAEKFVDGIIRNRFEIVCNVESKMVHICKGLCPPLYFWITDGIVKKARHEYKKCTRTS